VIILANAYIIYKMSLLSSGNNTWFSLLLSTLYFWNELFGTLWEKKCYTLLWSTKFHSVKCVTMYICVPISIGFAMRLGLWQFETNHGSRLLNGFFTSIMFVNEFAAQPLCSNVLTVRVGHPCHLFRPSTVLFLGDPIGSIFGQDQLHQWAVPQFAVGTLSQFAR